MKQNLKKNNLYFSNHKFINIHFKNDRKVGSPHSWVIYPWIQPAADRKG